MTVDLSKFKHVAVMDVHNTAGDFICSFKGMGFGEITPHPTAEGIVFHRFMGGRRSAKAELAWMKALHKHFRLDAVVVFQNMYRPDREALELADGIKTLDDKIPVLLFTPVRLEHAIKAGYLETSVDPKALDSEIRGFHYLVRSGQGENGLTIKPWSDEKPERTLPATIRPNLDYVSSGWRDKDVLKAALGPLESADPTLGFGQLFEIQKQIKAASPQDLVEPDESRTWKRLAERSPA